MHTPFVGEEFRSKTRRLLVLGESHHGDPEDDYPEFTPDVVQAWREGTNLRYFTILAAALGTTWENAGERQSVFRDIAFANYIQTVLPSADAQPRAEDLEGAEAQFETLLRDLDPTHILVTSRRAWDHWLPPSDMEMTVAVFGEKSFDLAYYKTPSGHAGAISVPHLSKFFSSSEWRVPIADFLAWTFGSGPVVT